MKTKDIADEYHKKRELFWKLQEEWVRESKKEQTNETKRKLRELKHRIANIKTDMKALKEEFQMVMAEKYQIY